jgi:Uncharacterised nucleotidyltransferase
MADIDWERALAFANDELVTPGLYAAIQSTGFGHRLPSDVSAYLVYLHDLNQARNAFMRQQLIEVLKVWNDAGIVPTVVKGGIALLNNEDVMTERMMADLDFLFDPADVEKAVEIAEAIGYRRDIDYPHGGHALTCLVRPGEPASLDMLLSLLYPLNLLPVEVVRRRSVLVQRDEVRALVLSPEDQVMHLVLHDMVHHNRHRDGIMSLRTLTDFARMMKAHPTLDWAMILCELKEHGSHNVLRALAHAAGELLGATSPALETGGPAALIYYWRGVSRWRRHPTKNQPPLMRLFFSGLAYNFDPAARIVPLPVKVVRRLLYGPEPIPADMSLGRTSAWSSRFQRQGGSRQEL